MLNKIPNNTSGPLILCVDDEEEPLELRAEILTRAGYKVLTATTAADGLKLAVYQNVDLVITDHLLKNVHGSELAEKIKLLKPDLPVLLLSGIAQLPADMKHVDSFMSK